MVSEVMCCFNSLIMTIIDKIGHYLHYLILICTVFKLVYLSIKVYKNVTLCCIISILVLLTHMNMKDAWGLVTGEQGYSENTRPVTYCSVLYITILCSFTIVYCSVLNCTIVYCSVLSCTVVQKRTV